MARRQGYTSEAASAASKMRRYKRKWAHARYLEKKAAGECMKCSKPAIEGSTVCEEHTVARRESYARGSAEANVARRARNAERLARGVCRSCPEPVVDGIVFCARHQEIFKKSRLGKQSERSSSGLCLKCDTPVVPGYSSCEKHLAYCRKKANQRYRDSVDAGACIHCGVDIGETESVSCKSCKDKATASRKSKRDAWVLAGLCRQCGSEKHPKAATCQRCRLRQMAADHLVNGCEWNSLLDLFNSQNGKCFYSGLPIVIGVDASIDHTVAISNGGEFTIENVRFVHKSINQMKGSLSEEEFLKMVELVFKNRSL